MSGNRQCKFVVFAPRRENAHGRGRFFAGREWPMLGILAFVAVAVVPPEQAARPVPVPQIAVRADMSRRPVRWRGITVPIPPAAEAIALPQVEGPRDPSRPLVVIDAGHGGHDPGAINADFGWREKDVTLAIASALRDELLKGGRIRVALTRDDDEFLILQERYGIARALGADLFVSIHADAALNPDARGATVYTLSEVASNREAARLAARENKSDLINGIDLSGQATAVSNILIDLARRETMEESARFAELLVREVGTTISFQTPAHHYASLVVLKAPDIPSVLVETGYISNQEDGAMLVSRAGQRRIAKGIARAVAIQLARKAVR